MWERGGGEWGRWGGGGRLAFTDFGCMGEEGG